MAMTISGRPTIRDFRDLPGLNADFLDVQITNAQMLLIRATPITLVAAQGANRATIVDRVHVVSDSSGAAWTESIDNLDVRYAASTVILTLETTGLITTGDVQIRNQAPAVAVATPLVNTAIELFNSGDGEFGGGDAANTFSVRVYFRVVDTVAFS